MSDPPLSSHDRAPSRGDHTETVAFEVDAVDPQWQDGWSVVVEGRVAAVEDPDEAAALAELPLRSWAEKQRRIYVRLHPSDITGRRLQRFPRHGGGQGRDLRPTTA